MHSSFILPRNRHFCISLLLLRFIPLYFFAFPHLQPDSLPIFAPTARVSSAVIACNRASQHGFELERLLQSQRIQLFRLSYSELNPLLSSDCALTEPLPSNFPWSAAHLCARFPAPPQSTMARPSRGRGVRITSGRNSTGGRQSTGGSGGRVQKTGGRPSTTPTRRGGGARAGNVQRESLAPIGRA